MLRGRVGGVSGVRQSRGGLSKGAGVGEGVGRAHRSHPGSDNCYAPSIATIPAGR